MSEAFPLSPTPEGRYRAIEPNRRLISPALGAAYGIEELSDLQTGKRLLRIPRTSAQTRLHEQLSEHFIPVFPVTEADADTVALSLPGDARTLQDSLRFIARDVLHYSEVFHQLGEVLGRSQAAGFGVLSGGEERSLLAGAVYSSSSSEAYGSAVHLSPPYLLTTDRSKTEELALLREELVNSRTFDGLPMVDHLVHAASEGWNSVRA